MRNLEVVYNDVALVLRGVSLEVPTGAIVALLGANGAGKTTLLRAVTGLLRVHRGEITKGSVELEGEAITGRDPADIVRRGIAQVMEGRRIFAELTVEENLRAGAFTRRDKAEVRQAHERVMDLFPRLHERLKATAGYLSGGEQQMLAIGRALMANPRLLLLDEPSLGLAPVIVDKIYEIIREINQRGVTILLVEQNANYALEVSSRGYVLETGHVAVTDSSDNLRTDERVRAAYLGA